MNAVKEENAPPATPFSLATGLDANRLAELFLKKRRLRIPDFLEPTGALALYQHLTHEVRWRAFLASRGRLLAAPANVTGTYAQEAEKALLDRAWSARNDYAFLYEADRLFPEDLSVATEVATPQRTALLHSFQAFVNSSAFLELLRATTRIPDIHRADIQATRHRPGHFTGFSTAAPRGVQADEPCAAFSLNLTPEWTGEWGGLLAFHSNETFTIDAYVPSFNVLDVHAIPYGHWITVVTPFADAPRLVVSGRLYRPCQPEGR